MRKWLNRLFYFICFFALVIVIYRLALVTPPRPDEEGYLGFCCAAAGIAVLCAGSAAGFAALADWMEQKSGTEKRKRHLTDGHF